MKISRKVTIYDVAREAGVSTFTVSRALGDCAWVAAKTRRHVKAVAERLGYRRNTVASLLGKHRAGDNKKGRLLVAMVCENKLESAFIEECEAMGWDGREFLVRELPSHEVAKRVLWQQGVDGIVVNGAGERSLGYPFWKGSQDFDWERFSVVKISRGLPELKFDLVQHSAFDYMMLTLERALASGGRKMAVVLLKSLSEIDDTTRLGAVLAFMAEKLPAGVQCEWRVSREAGDVQHMLDASTIGWLKSYRPDTIVAYHWLMLPQLLEAGFKIPEKVSFAAVLGNAGYGEGLPAISGCDVSVSVLFRRALALLGESISRGERGFPTHPAEYIIEPEWIEGETLIARQRR